MSSSGQITAGFRNAGWTMGHLPDDVRVGVHPLATQDGAAVNGLLYGSGRTDLVFCIMHPREFMASHYLVPELTAAGHSVWTQTSRSVGQDLRLEHEVALLDVAAGLSFLKRQGFRRVVLIGNSGGASLYGFYNEQSLLAPERRLERSPGGRPVRLAEAEMPVADGIVLVSPHPGQGQLLMRCIDPAVVDEGDPTRSDPGHDFLNPANGYSDGPQGARYSADFVARHREAQEERVARIDAHARESIEARMQARRRSRDGGGIDDRRRAAQGDIITVWRTDADLRCWDPTLDPSDRVIGSVWGKDPFITNFGVPGFGRLATPEAWLSTWSGLSSRADLYRTAGSVEQPCLQIEYSGDNTVFPSDADAIFAAVATGAKQRLRFRGDHHGRALVPDERPGRVDAGEAIRSWARATFGL
jgi:hypothetical protein